MPIKIQLHRTRMGTSNEHVLLDNTINNLHTYITLSVGKCENKLIKSLKRNKLKKCIEDRWVRLSDWGDNNWLQLPRPPHTHSFRSAWLSTNSASLWQFQNMTTTTDRQCTIWAHGGGGGSSSSSSNPSRLLHVNTFCMAFIKQAYFPSSFIL